MLLKEEECFLKCASMLKICSFVSSRAEVKVSHFLAPCTTEEALALKQKKRSTVTAASKSKGALQMMQHLSC